MFRHPLLRTFLILVFLTLTVFFSFRFIFPAILPFLLSLALMQWLSPVIIFLQKRCHLPNWLAHTLCLGGFFFTAGGILFFIVWQFCRQFQTLLHNIPVYQQLYGDWFCQTLEKCCHYTDHYLSLSDGSSYLFINSRFEQFQTTTIDKLCDNAGNIVSFCVSCGVQTVTFLLLLCIGMIVLCHDLPDIQSSFQHSRYYLTLHQIYSTMRESFISFLRSQGIVLFVNWLVCSTALALIHNPYFILVGFFIALIDALPILGSGIILIPYVICKILFHHYYAAAILFTAYGITVLVRKLLEARLLGRHMSMPAFYILASGFLGLKYFGLMGIFLGPFSVVLIRTLYTVFFEEPPVS